MRAIYPYRTYFEITEDLVGGAAIHRLVTDSKMNKMDHEVDTILTVISINGYVCDFIRPCRQWYLRGGLGMRGIWLMSRETLRIRMTNTIPT
jgi:hypothetical protein